MRTTDVPVARYKCSEAHLISRCRIARRFLLDNIAELTPKGITPEVVATFAALINSYAEVHNDSWWVSEHSKAVAVRNAKRQEISILIEELRGVCKIALPSEVYAGFRYDNLRLATNREFASRIETIVLNAVANLAALEPKGITAVWLEELTAAKEQFAALRDQADNAETERTVRKIERVTAGNELWDALNDLCQTAIIYYRRRDPAITSGFRKLITTRKRRKAKKSAVADDELPE